MSYENQVLQDNLHMGSRTTLDLHETVHRRPLKGRSEDFSSWFPFSYTIYT